jgi:hypothetical protein
VTNFCTSLTESSLHRTIPHKQDSKSPQDLMNFASFEPQLLFFAFNVFLFGLAPEKPAMQGPFRYSFYGILVKTTPDAVCFFLHFDLGRSEAFEDRGLISSTGVYSL